MKNHYKQGLSIIEIIVAVAILGIIFLVVIPQFSKIRDNQVIKSAVQDTLSAIDKARTETLSSLNSSEYGVHFQSDQVIIFKGKVFSAGDANNEIFGITAPASITNVTFGGTSGVSGDIYFNRLSGAPSTTGTITISNNSFSKIITISATGVASVN
ncbi:MAG: prepilin-type N-terminal cleavage/methylation domain-containing protein [Patescibacteria group bacterium]|nr:prepilin-type N-terminal cleavage/methylation domain-containing protein [Patescibacteria group bacterium]